MGAIRILSLCVAMIVPLSVSAVGVKIAGEIEKGQYRLHYDAYEGSPVGRQVLNYA